MLSKKLIIERYIGDLKAHVPQSPARDQRLEMLENELEAIKNHGVIGDVSQQRELLIAFCDWYNKEIPDYLEKSDKTIDRYLDSNL